MQLKILLRLLRAKGRVLAGSDSNPSIEPVTIRTGNKQRQVNSLFTMTVTHDLSRRGSAQLVSNGMVALEERFEVLKEIGDGSFGSVVLARVRTAGASVARRGTVVCASNPLTRLSDCRRSS